jgi:hypothetical protein
VALRLQAGDTPLCAEAFDLPGCGSRRGRFGSVQPRCHRDVRRRSRRFGHDRDRLRRPFQRRTIMPMIAAMRPDLVRKYVLVSCIAPPPGQTIIELMTGVWKELGSAQPAGSGLDMHRAMFCNDMTDAYVQAFMARLGQDHWPTHQAMPQTDWCYDPLADKDSTFMICMQDRALIPA